MAKLLGRDERDGWYDVSPADAAAWYEEKHPNNRPMSEVTARGFADVIASGGWKPNGEPLIFDADGKNLDGQHRLRAVVLANKSVTFYCVFGVHSNWFSSIDNGRSRTGANAAAIIGVKDYALAAAVANWAIRYEKEWMFGGNLRIPNSDVVAWLRKHRDELESALDDLPHAHHGHPTLVTPSVLAFVYFMARRQNARKAKEFMTGVTTGENLPSGSPILALLNGLRTKRVHDRLPRPYVMAYTVKAWNAFHAGRSLRVLKHTRVGRGDGLPRIGDKEDETAE